MCPPYNGCQIVLQHVKMLDMHMTGSQGHLLLISCSFLKSRTYTTLPYNDVKLNMFVISSLRLAFHICLCRRPGGDRIYAVFDCQLPVALRKLPLDRHLAMQNVRKVVSEADGYQPHLIAPEQGYRRLIDGALNYFRGPAEASVDAVSTFTFSCFYPVDVNCHIT